MRTLDAKLDQQKLNTSVELCTTTFQADAHLHATASTHVGHATASTHVGLKTKTPAYCGDHSAEEQCVDQLSTSG